MNGSLASCLHWQSIYLVNTTEFHDFFYIHIIKLLITKLNWKLTQLGDWMFFKGYISVLCSFLLFLSEGQTYENRQPVDCSINSSTYMKPKKCNITNITKIIDMKTLGYIVPAIQCWEPFCVVHIHLMVALCCNQTLF